MTIINQLSDMGGLLAAMALFAAIEAIAPLRARTRWNRAHVAANLSLTLVTFAVNAGFAVALVALFSALESARIGLLHALPLGPAAHTAVAVLALDLAFYAFHRSSHKVPLFWRFHRVHHSDPAMDVTTTFRQHPGEAVVRTAFLAVFGAAIGAGPAGYAVYRGLSALVAVLEHANWRVPRRLDDALSLVVTWPNYHKVHHSRDARMTDSNYSNILSWWDRLFGSYTPARAGASIDYGLDGCDDDATQSVRGLLALPFRDPAPRDGALPPVRARADHA